MSPNHFMQNILSVFRKPRPVARIVDFEKPPNQLPKLIYARVVGLVKSYIRSFQVDRNVTLHMPDKNFDIVERMLDVESYVRRGRDRYVELIWKNSFEIVGQNEKAVQYISRRFDEISYMSEMPMLTFFETISSLLIPFGNVFIVKIRDKRRSSGKERMYFGKIVQPVAGYFLVKPQNVIPCVNKVTRELEKWIIKFDTNMEKEYDFRDVIHMYLYRKPGDIFGDIPYASIVDDVRALRRMEENAELLVFQYAIPLYHYKIGTKERPCVDSSEIDAARHEVETMLSEGMIITSEREEIKAIGSQREALDLDRYMSYFKDRILSGMGHSTVSIGEGSDQSRASSVILTRSVIETATRYQRIIKTFIDKFIINELLEEGGFDVLDSRNRVEIYIPPIDIDEKIRTEYHAIALYQSDLITETEARKMLGRNPIKDEQRADMYFERVTKPKALIMASDEQFLMNSPNMPSPVPVNQYGIKKVGPKARFDVFGGDVLRMNASLSSIREMYRDIFVNQYEATCDDILRLYDDTETQWNTECIFGITRDFIIDRTSQLIVNAFRTGMRDAGFEVSDIQDDLKALHREHTRTLCGFFDNMRMSDDLMSREVTDRIKIRRYFDDHFDSVLSLVDWILRKAYWYGYARSLVVRGIRCAVQIDEHPMNETCRSYAGPLGEEIRLDKLPGFVDKCTCKIMPI